LAITLTDGHKGWKSRLRIIKNEAVTTNAAAHSSSKPASPGKDGSPGSPLITVAICTRNREHFLRKAVQSVLGQIAGEAEILIIDNASTDTTPEAAARLAADNPCVTVCRENEVGLSAARNTALSKARGKYVLFLDDDAVADAGWFSAYHRFLSAPPSGRIAVVGGAVLPDYEVWPPKWLAPELEELNLGEAVKRISARDGPWGGNSAYRRAVVLQEGMFDTRLGRKGPSLGAHEESELNQRLEKAGYEIWWLPPARIKHFIPAGRVRLRWHLRSQFNQGRSSVILRLGSMGGEAPRALFRLGRVLVAPFHIAICLLAAAVMLPRRQGQTAAAYLLRAGRIAGITRESLVWSRRP